MNLPFSPGLITERVARFFILFGNGYRKAGAMVSGTGTTAAPGTGNQETHPSGTREDSGSAGTLGGTVMDRRIIMAGILIGIFLMISPISAATEKVILYQANFSTNPNWTTNNPSRYYWNETNGMYHYFVEGGTNGYAFIPVPHDDSSFVLEFDILPTRTDKDSAFRFGITGSDMNINKGPSVYTSFSNKKSVPSMWLRVISQNNNLYEIGSLNSAYPGETRVFEDGVPYHVTVRYQKERRTVDIKVNEKTNNTPVWGYFMMIDQELYVMDRLAISSVGDYGNIGKSAEGYVDNVDLYTYRDVLPNVTPTTAETTTFPTLTTMETTPPTTPAPTTSKAAPGPWIPLIASAILGLLAVAGRRRV
jgi:hypothetical protein